MRVWKIEQNFSMKPLTNPVILFIMFNNRSISKQDNQTDIPTDESLCSLVAQGSDARKSAIFAISSGVP